jgi:HlyD family secretion protein
MLKVINRNIILTFITIIGTLSGAYMLILDLKPLPAAQSGTPRTLSPYENFVFGVGLIEAASGNIGLGTPIGAVVQEVLVKQGDIIPKGTPIFTLDARQASADLKVKQVQLEAAKVEVEKAKASLSYAQTELDLVEHLTDKRGITKEEFINRQSNALIAQIAVKYAQLSLKVVETQVIESQIVLDYYTVRAPIDCEILQINIHPGEYAASEFLTTPLFLVGDVSRYHVRVNISENDAWRFKKGEPAVAYIPANPEYHTDLQFEYIEPYVIAQGSVPDSPLGQRSSRVLQIVYSFDPKTMPSYLGQELDVFIRAEQKAPKEKQERASSVSK